jgi:pantoate--beta-alanine ligase
MILFKKAAELHNYLDSQRKHGLKIGFVPTMGALHRGHISLVADAKANTDITVCSIFVNPAQFNDPNDFKKYPVTIEKDLEMLVEAGCTVLFLPYLAEIYPEGVWQDKHYDLGNLEKILEGQYRPGHFQGVCMVVERLLKIVVPDILFIGQKDYQQCMVIQRLISLMGLADEIQVRISPTLRETDGLAMSSRNMRLSPEDRHKARAISETLFYIKQNFLSVGFDHLKASAKASLEAKGFNVDYVTIADAGTLELVDKFQSRQGLVALAAASIDGVRLIDNIVLT